MCFLFHDTATTSIYTLSLHDALPIYDPDGVFFVHGRHIHDFEMARERCGSLDCLAESLWRSGSDALDSRSEEHTSELQSRRDLVCRLLLEKKKEYQFKRISCLSLRS